jgi:vitamin B12 transporter
VVAHPVESCSSSVSVVTSAELEAASAQSVDDVLEDVPGISLLASGGRAGVTTAFIRGGDSNFTLVLLDGLPLNDGTEVTGGSVNLDELSTDLIERAEIVRGPRTSFYGPGSLSGVVQFFTRRGAQGPTRVDVGADFGTAQMGHGVARVAGSRGDSTYSTGASWQQERGRVGEDEFKGLEVWGTGDTSLTSSTRLGLTGRFAAAQTSDYPDTSGGPVYGSGLRRDSDRDDLTVGARLDRDARNGRHERLQLGVVRRALERSSPEIPPQVPASQEDTAFTRLRASYDTSLIRGARTTLEAGVSAENERGTNASVLELPAAFGGDTPGDYHTSRTTGGAYVGLRHVRGPVLVEAALRTDLATGAAAQLNPNVGVLWQAAGPGKTNVHASFGRASKLPSFFALASPRALGGNPQLVPEYAWGGEIGLNHVIMSGSPDQGRLDAGVSFFRQEYRDLVDFDFDTFQLVNRASVAARGVEMRAGWRALKSVSIDLQATWLDAHESEGVPLLHRPRWRGGARVHWQPSTRIDLRVGTRAISRSLDRQLAGPDRDSVAGYGLVDIAGSWTVRDQWKLRARVDNATDRHYETLIGFPGLARSFSIGLAWNR